LLGSVTAVARVTGGRADMSHDMVQDLVVEVTVVGDASQTAIPQKTLEPSIERPLHIPCAGILGVEELPREAIHIWVGRPQRIGAHRSHVISSFVTVRPPQGRCCGGWPAAGAGSAGLLRAPGRSARR